MKKNIKIIFAIFISILLLAVMLIPAIYGSAMKDNDNKTVDVKWYYENGQTLKEVKIPKNLDIKANETCTIYGYITYDELDSYIIVLRTSYQKLKIYVDEEEIYSYDTDDTRPYGKADPSKMHYVLLPDDIVGRKISISVTSPFERYSGYFSNIEIGNYDTFTQNVFYKYNIELIFGTFIILLSIFLVLSNAIVVKFNKVSRSIYYIFGASLSLGLWMMFDSVLIGWIFDEFFIGQFIYISLHTFSIMFGLFINTESNKHIKPLTIIVSILSIVNLITQNILNILNVYDFVEMLLITLVLLFVEIILLFINRVIRYKTKHHKTLIEFVEIILVLALLVSFILDVYLLMNTFININIVIGSIFVIIAIITHYKVIYRLSEEAETSKELKTRLSQTQNYLIQSQMKPHFIFNTLGAIRTMIKSDPDKAYNLTASFSKYLRANINNISPTETIAFAQEMDHVKTYVDIEKARFGERLKVVYDIKCDDFNMPPLTIEPLVENAVKHGVCKKIKGGTVKISSWEEKDRYIVTVEDDGVGFDVLEQNEKSEKSDSVGIKYIKLRLKEISNADFEIESKKDVGTKATLTFFK